MNIIDNDIIIEKSNITLVGTKPMHTAYHMPGKKCAYAVSVAQIKQCAVAVNPKLIRYFHIHFKKHHPTMIKIKGRSKLQTVTYRKYFSNTKEYTYGTTQLARFDSWEITFPIYYRKDAIDKKQIVDAYSIAGSTKGIGVQRIETGFSLGTFIVKE